MNFKVLGTTFGVILFLLGFFALIISFVGVKLSFLLWIDKAGSLGAFIIRLCMIIFGAVLFTLAQTDWQKERKIPPSDLN